MDEKEQFRLRKLRSVLAVFIVVFLAFPSVVHAETRTAKEYMSEGIRAAYDNMHLIYEAYYDDEGNLETQPARYVAIQQKWKEDRLSERTYHDENGKLVERTDGYCKIVFDEGGGFQFFNLENQKINAYGLNFVKDITINIDDDGWSEWITPDVQTSNSCFYIGSFILDEKNVNSVYTCQFEIEFKDVEASPNEEFRFSTHGRSDGKWDIGNPWRSMVYMREPPEDRIYKFQKSFSLNEETADVREFQIGFRCDFWQNGKYRVRNIKIEKGEDCTEWSPGI